MEGKRGGRGGIGARTPGSSRGELTPELILSRVGPWLGKRERRVASEKEVVQHIDRVRKSEVIMVVGIRCIEALAESQSLENRSN
jgi:hypothetical protein